MKQSDGIDCNQVIQRFLLFPTEPIDFFSWRASSGSSALHEMEWWFSWDPDISQIVSVEFLELSLTTLLFYVLPLAAEAAWKSLNKPTGINSSHYWITCLKGDVYRPTSRETRIQIHSCYALMSSDNSATSNCWFRYPRSAKSSISTKWPFLEFHCRHSTTRRTPRNPVIRNRGGQSPIDGVFELANPLKLDNSMETPRPIKTESHGKITK